MVRSKLFIGDAKVKEKLKVTGKVSKAKVSKTLKKAGQEMAETHEDVELGEIVYTQPTCNVGFAMGFTKNLGNYESMRVDVSLHIPCYPDEIGEIFEKAKQWVDDKLTETKAEIEKDLNG